MTCMTCVPQRSRWGVKTKPPSRPTHGRGRPPAHAQPTYYSQGPGAGGAHGRTSGGYGTTGGAGASGGYRGGDLFELPSLGFMDTGARVKVMRHVQVGWQGAGGGKLGLAELVAPGLGALCSHAESEGGYLHWTAARVAASRQVTPAPRAQPTQHPHPIPLALPTVPPSLGPNLRPPAPPASSTRCLLWTWASALPLSWTQQSCSRRWVGKCALLSFCPDAFRAGWANPGGWPGL